MKPNILFITCHDLGRHLGCYGHSTVHSPALDALAGQGVKFENSFGTAPQCSPSRSSIVTGRYPHATDAEQLHWPLPGHHVTLAEELRSAGYWCAAVGKWHLGEEIKDPVAYLGGSPARVSADPVRCTFHGWNHIRTRALH